MDLRRGTGLAVIAAAQRVHNLSYLLSRSADPVPVHAALVEATGVIRTFAKELGLSKLTTRAEDLVHALDAPLEPGGHEQIEMLADRVYRMVEAMASAACDDEVGRGAA